MMVSKFDPDLKLILIHLASHIGFLSGAEARVPTEYKQTIDDMSDILRAAFTPMFQITTLEGDFHGKGKAT